MVRLELPLGYVALIDDADEERVQRYRWHLKRHAARPGCVYAQTTVRLTPGRNGKKTSWALHRYILDAKPGEVVDHVNGDTLDCRRANLPVTDSRGNSMNVTKSHNQRRGGYKGVSWNRNASKWEAGICAGEPRADGRRRRIYLGLFDDPCDAARAYDAAATAHFGEFAALNFPPEAGG